MGNNTEYDDVEILMGRYERYAETHQEDDGTVPCWRCRFLTGSDGRYTCGLIEAPIRTVPVTKEGVRGCPRGVVKEAV